MRIEIRKYDLSYKVLWNEFVSNSKNATFLFYRDYMDYHSERFTDHSLIVFYNQNAIALFPANINQDQIISHGGLTYGGVLMNSHIDTVQMLNIVEAIINYYRKIGIRKISYKAIPYFYHDLPAQEDLYALFRNGFNLIGRQVSTVVDLKNFKIHANRKNGYNKCLKNGIRIEESLDFETFFSIVNDRLRSKYEIEAVHKPSEIRLLQKKFTSNIRLFSAFLDNEMLGGALLYINKKTVHAQYLAASEKGREMRVLDFINICMIQEFKENYSYYDFGYSTEKGGLILNETLIKQKEEFGGSAICYDIYESQI